MVWKGFSYRMGMTDCYSQPKSKKINGDTCKYKSIGGAYAELVSYSLL